MWHKCQIEYQLNQYMGYQLVYKHLWFPPERGLNWFDIDTVRDEESKPMYLKLLIDPFIPSIIRRPMLADLGYHSPKPMYENHKSMGPCEVLDGRECYYDGSTLSAMKIFKALLTDGEEGVWRELKDYHEYVFGCSLLKRIGKKIEGILMGYLRFTGAVSVNIDNIVRKLVK